MFEYALNRRSMQTTTDYIAFRSRSFSQLLLPHGDRFRAHSLCLQVATDNRCAPSAVLELRSAVLGLSSGLVVATPK